MATANQVEGAKDHVERFSRDLEALIAPQEPIGVAVSGGADSLALLLLAIQARPLQVEAATVDHALREGSRAEAEMVQSICEHFGVPHQILTANWAERPEAAIQERARFMRYRLLGGWAHERGLSAILTAHHLDDQAETFFMRLSRGAGVRGLSSMRRFGRAPGAAVALARPLLGWRHSELVAVCEAAGIKPADDPSNEDEQFERVRVRRAIVQSRWIDVEAVGRSAAHLAEADAAVQWATTIEWKRAVSPSDDHIVYRPSDAPKEIRRRIIRRAILSLASEGGGELRGRELDRVHGALANGRRTTLRGVLCIGGAEWNFARAPTRRL
jgi:tRNA(Ile)-lysidine synthase